MIRLQQHPVNPVENSRIGLAGPIWGLGAALAALAVYLVSGWPSWLAIARVGAWINLFNLTPIWQLDGGRGFSSMSRHQRRLALAVIAAAWFLTAENLLLLLLFAGGFQALQGGARTSPTGWASPSMCCWSPSSRRCACSNFRRSTAESGKMAGPLELTLARPLPRAAA